MIKRTLYFSSPAYLSLTDKQLQVRLPEVEKNELLPADFKKQATATIPVEDIGLVVLDHQQITVTNGLLQALQANNVAVMVCDNTHLPQALLLPLEGNTIQQERYEQQLTATEPLKKQLWAQTVAQKIKNQAKTLELLSLKNDYLIPLYKNIKSGDADNCEATAAIYYWQTLFKHINGFVRHREGMPPNNYLNYGYAILRGIIARSLVGAGLLPTLGIFHRNRYNAYCLADDVMEPYRPYVDRLVFELVHEQELVSELTKEHKKEFLKLPQLDVLIDGQQSPLMIAAQRTAVSLVKCFEGSQRKLLYPEVD